MALSSFRKRVLGLDGPKSEIPVSESDIPAKSSPQTDAIETDSTQSLSEPGDVEKGQTNITARDGDDDQISDDDPVLRDIPWEVRRVVSLHDDPNLPTLTFRYFLLTILFVAPGAFLSQMSHYRTTYAPYSVFFVQIASNYVGLWLAKILPSRVITVPFTKSGFSLNPGPWSVKEHVLVTISAASGATYNLA